MKPSTLEAGAEDVVIRARNGDQNAMGMISEVGKQAKAGNPKAQQGFRAIQSYIEKNPTQANRVTLERDSHMGFEAVKVIQHLKNITKRQSTMGADGPPDAEANRILCVLIINLPFVGGERALNAGTVALANGPKLTDSKIRQIGETIPDDAIRTIFYRFVVQYCPNGSEGSLPRNLIPVAKAGQCVGQARAIQIARTPNGSLSSISPKTGWELGETQALINQAMAQHVQQYHAPQDASK